jgi:uncharacterized protein YqgC (DUF456 family)
MLFLLKVLGYGFFVLCQPLAIVLSALGMPGSVLILLSALTFSAATGWHRPSWGVLIVLVVLAVLCETLDNLMSVLGVRRYGGSLQTSLASGCGAIAGAILAGAFVSPLLALPGGPIAWLLAVVLVPIAGAATGGFAVAYLLEIRRGASPNQARSAGFGAVVGKVLGALGRVILTSAMAVLAVVSAFFPAS